MKNETVSHKTNNNQAIKAFFICFFSISIIANFLLLYNLQKKDDKISQLNSSLESMRSDYYQERNSRIEYQEKYNKLSEEKTAEMFQKIIDPRTGKPIRVGKSVSFNSKVYDEITPYQQRNNDQIDYIEGKNPIRMIKSETE